MLSRCKVRARDEVARRAAQHMEQGIRQLRWVWVSALLAGGLAIPSHAETVILEAYVFFALEDDGGTPLVDGSVVQIIGSLNASQDGFQSYGSATNLLSDTTLGDNIILKQFVVNSASVPSSAGTFFTTTTFESDEVANAYIRFFDFQASPVTGLVDYGSSATYLVSDFSSAFKSVDFAPTIELPTNQTKHFSVIPEPGTSHLVLLFSWTLFWFGGHRRRRSPVGVVRRVAAVATTKERRLPPDG